MTRRAVIIGLLLGLILAAFGYFNDWVMKQAYVASDLVPISVYGFLVLGLLLANPLLRWVRGWEFNGAEWCVIVSLMLVACVVPGPGLMWNFASSIAMPHHYHEVNPGWRDKDVLSYVHPNMLVDPSDNPDRVIGGFKTGLDPGRIVPVTAVPWSSWGRTLSFWIPLIALSFVAGICIVLVVHAQWSQRERLRYPVADFASELIGGSGERPLARIFYNRKFWMGFIPVVAILLINGYQLWNTESINIPLRFELGQPFTQKWPILKRIPHFYLLFRPSFYFAAIGFAYFVSSEVSFSLGISGILHAVVFLSLFNAGVRMEGAPMSGGIRSFQMFGAYLGLGIIIFYTGRRFYLSVLRRMLWLPAADPPARSIVWFSRIALLCAAAMVVILTLAVDLNVFLAIGLVLLIGLMFLIITRINVETGLFFIQPGWQAVAILLALFGINAMGPTMLMTLAMLCIVLTVDPRVCLMPLAANALRLSETEKLSPLRLGRWMIVAVLLALMVGMFATIYVQYNFGSDSYWWANSAAQFPFNMLMQQLPKFTGDVEDLVRWELFRPDNRFLVAAGVGVGLVLIFSAMRLRYSWWPIHPVIFLVWGTWSLGNLTASFMLGWLIKTMITRFGGGKAYRGNKPVFVGMVAGEFVAGIIFAIVGLIYYLITDVPGPTFRVHP